jgi:hypothetical protein
MEEDLKIKQDERMLFFKHKKEMLDRSLSVVLRVTVNISGLGAFSGLG